MIPGILAGIIGAQIARMAMQKPGAGGPPPPSDGEVAFWYLLRLLTAAVIVSVLGLNFYLLPLSIVIGLLAFLPWPVARWVLIPLGLHRLAYYLTFTSGYTFHVDRRGGPVVRLHEIAGFQRGAAFRLDRRGCAALAAAWAVARQPKLDEAAAEWVTGKLAQGETLGGAGIFASGLLLAARGDLDGARALIESVRELDPRACPPAVRRLANGWLAAYAAARGDWLRASELGLSLDEGGREAWLLSGVGQSLRLEPMSPGPLGLWLRWALAPQRRKTLPLVRRALAALDGAFIELEAEAPLKPAAKAPEGDDLSLALSLHAAMLSRPRGAVTGEDIRALSQAWDAVLTDRAMERGLEVRALVLGASGPKPTLSRLRGDIEDDLTAVVLAADLSLKELGGRGGMAEQVRLRVRDRLLSEVEAMSDAVCRRRDERRELPAIDEWREWSALRQKYERGVRLAGADFRRLAFYKIHPDACNLAVWLFNDRKQRPLGNAIFRFLLAEAEAVEDQRAVALQTKNVACGV